MRVVRNRRASAHTLIELVVSLSVTGLLMVGIGSTMVLASRAMPERSSPLDLSREAFLVVEQVSDELYAAKSFTVKTGNVIEFAVDDRNSDGSPETIRYEWSGTVGDPLRRTYNGGSTLDVADDVHQFQLTFSMDTVVESTTQMGPTWSPEAAVAFFDGWAGLTPASQTQNVNQSQWASESFSISIPAGTTAIRFTQAQVMMYRPSAIPIDPAQYRFAIHRPTKVNGVDPSATPLVTTPWFDYFSVTTTTQWKAATFNAVNLTDLSRSDFCLVVSGDSVPFVNAVKYVHNSAPANGMRFRSTTNGGALWGGPSMVDSEDIRFYVYASFESQSPQPVEVSRQFLESVRVTLQLGDQSATRIDTEAQVLNRPEVTGL